MPAIARLSRRACLLLALLAAPLAQAALTPEQATRVGGGLGEASVRLAAMQKSAQAVVAAAPGTLGALSNALSRIAGAPGERGLVAQLAALVLALALAVAFVLVFRVATRSARLAAATDPQPARGAVLQLALDALERAVVGVCAYLALKTVFSGGGLQDLFALALLWAGLRWWIAMLLVEALLWPA
jgi:hypothetical protein